MICMRCNSNTQTVNVFGLFVILLTMISCTSVKEDPISMTLSETKLTYEKDGGSKIVNVLGNAEGEITWSELPGGIEIVKEGNDLTITAASNPAPYEWEKEIFIIRGGISVPLLIKQKAGDVHIDTDEKELELSNRAGNKYSIPIKTNAKEITIKEKVSWVEASLSKDNILLITSTDNPSKEERSGKIVLMAEGKDFEISITQLGVPYIELSVSEITFPMEGGEKKIRFKMNRSMEALEGIIRKNDEISVHVSFKESTIIVKTARTFRKKEMIWDIPIGFVDEYGETQNQILRVKQAPDTMEEDLKKILEEFYYAMEGKHWKNNTNWLSNKSPDEWYGITYDDWNGIISINLQDNGLKGTIPASFYELKSISRINLAKNDIRSDLSPNFAKLTSLTSLQLNDNNITGVIPKELEPLVDKGVFLILRGNKLHGELPPAILKKAEGNRQVWLKFLCPQQEGYGFSNFGPDKF